MHEYLLTRVNEFSRLLVARFARLKRSSASEMSCTEMQISVQAPTKNKMDVLPALPPIYANSSRGSFILLYVFETDFGKYGK